MSISTPSNRGLATAAGIVIVGATAHVTILKTGGYAFDTQAPLVLALALGVIAAARAIGSGELTGRLAAAAALTLLAGEAYNFASSLDRMIETREAMQAPLKAKATARDEALSRLNALETATAADTPRLRLARETLGALRNGSEGPAAKAARAALNEAQARVDTEAANIRCGKECKRKQDERDTARDALDAAVKADSADRAGQIARAESEVQAAATAASGEHAAALKAAAAAVEANPRPASATPTADRLNIAPWAWDMLIAGLLSFASAGLAAVLLAIGAQGETEVEKNNDLNVFRATLHAPLPDRAGPTIAERLPVRFPENEPPRPPKGGPRKRKTTAENVTGAANVITFPAGGKHPVVAALEKVGGSVASNRELAQLMGVTDGEASKRVAEIEPALILTKDGKQLRIALR